MRNGRGGNGLQGPILGAISARYRPAERMSAGYLISSDSIPKNKPIYQIVMKLKASYF